jgi:hypothetical protein
LHVPQLREGGRGQQRETEHGGSANAVSHGLNVTLFDQLRPLPHNASVPSCRLAAGRLLVAVVLTLAMPAQWEAFCGGWQSAPQAMACCHRAAHDAGPPAAFSCCTAQEQARHAQSPISAMPAIQLVSANLPVPAAATAPFCPEPPRPARSADSRLLASVFLI